MCVGSSLDPAFDACLVHGNKKIATVRVSHAPDSRDKTRSASNLFSLSLVVDTCRDRNQADECFDNILSPACHGKRYEMRILLFGRSSSSKFKAEKVDL